MVQKIRNARCTAVCEQEIISSARMLSAYHAAHSTRNSLHVQRVRTWQLECGGEEKRYFDLRTRGLFCRGRVLHHAVLTAYDYSDYAAAVLNKNGMILK